MSEKLFALDRGVIVACDIASLNELERTLKSTSGIDGIVGFKIGFSLVGNYELPNVVGKIKGFTHSSVINDH